MKGPGLLAGIGLALVLAAAVIGTPADADLWGHITFGRDILETGQIVQADAYAFTSDRAWVNHEWLSEIAFAKSYELAGSSGLVGLKVLVVAVLLGLIWRYLRRATPSTVVAAALLLLGFAGTFWRTHTVRPQLFSVLFFAVLLITLTKIDRGRRWMWLVIPPLMAVWVNVHGGWIVGVGVLGLWTAARIVNTQMPWHERLMLAVGGLLALGATLINPYGMDMWRFLGETVRLGRDDIEEWGSILTFPLALGLPWAMSFIAAALVVLRGKPRPRWDYVAIVALLAFSSFRVSRLDAFFSLATVILFTPELASVVERFVRARWPSRAASQTAKAPAESASAAGIIAITVITVAVMMVPAAKTIGPYATCLTIAGGWVPDEDAGRFILANHLKGRMLTWFDWGEYAIWHFGPDLQVSMDGRRETVYTEGTIQAHRRFYAADETAPAYLRALNPDYIWLPRRLPITNTLMTSGWTTAFDGPLSVVLARTGAGPFQQVAPSGTARRCFPGP